MNKHLLRPFYLIVALFLVIAMPILAVWPDQFFIIGKAHGFTGWFFIVILAFAAILLIHLFIMSFIGIQRKSSNKGNVIFNLLGSLLSLLFLMAAKVMADEVAHEWTPQAEKILQQGELWMLYVCLGFVAGFLLIVGLKRQHASS